MALTPKFTENDVKARFNKVLEVIVKRQVARLQELGEMCVTRAREIPAEVGFTDQTGNLRSSIGYMVFVNGVAVHNNYVQTLTGTEGMKNGKMLAEKIGSKFKNGVCLVVTAGMNYAIYLESKGRDVLTSAELLAKKELPRMVAELKSNINKAAQ
jgi:hypothetical protein